MMHPVALLDAFTMLCWLSAIVSLLLPRKSDLPQRVRLVLIGLTTSSFAYAACIFLGWANITSNLEQVEDLIGVTLPVWWGFAAYAMAQRVINADLDRNREELRYAQTVAQLISWKLDLASDRLTWTGDTDILFGGALAHLGTRREYHAIIHPEDRSRIEEAWNAAINGAEYECEYRIESQQTTFWVRERACFDRLLGGRQIRGTGAIHDVTARIQAEQERAELEAKLRQSQKLEAIGQLAGGVAHDFNNILTAILGSVDLELERLRSDPDEADARLLDSLALIERGAQRASALTRQLLAFGRCQTTNPTHLDLNALLKNLEMMMRRLISEDIFIEIVTGKHLRPVFADAGQLEQVIVNLAVNAADSMPKGGRLSIETANVELDDDYVAIHADTRYGPHVLLAVSDTGVGMPPAVYERVFEPFFTNQAGRQRHRPGTLHRLRHRQAERRPYHRLQRSRPGHDLQGLPPRDRTTDLHANRGFQYVRSTPPAINRRRNAAPLRRRRGRSQVDGDIDRGGRLHRTLRAVRKRTPSRPRPRTTARSTCSSPTWSCRI